MRLQHLSGIEPNSKLQASKYFPNEFFLEIFGIDDKREFEIVDFLGKWSKVLLEPFISITFSGDPDR